jgi:hypothetical protein
VRKHRRCLRLYIKSWNAIFGTGISVVRRGDEKGIPVMETYLFNQVNCVVTKGDQ